MKNGVQVKAVITCELKHQVFVALAVHEETFSHWLRRQLEAWLREVDATAREEREASESEGARTRM